MRAETFLPVLGRHAVTVPLVEDSIQLCCPDGAPVFAAVSGTVTLADGEVVLRSLDGELRIRYLGVDTANSDVRRGDVLAAGDLLGRSIGAPISGITIVVQRSDGSTIDGTTFFAGAADPGTRWPDDRKRLKRIAQTAGSMALKRRTVSAAANREADPTDAPTEQATIRATPTLPSTDRRGNHRRAKEPVAAAPATETEPTKTESNETQAQSVPTSLEEETIAEDNRPQPAQSVVQQSAIPKTPAQQPQTETAMEPDRVQEGTGEVEPPKSEGRRLAARRPRPKPPKRS